MIMFRNLKFFIKIFFRGVKKMERKKIVNKILYEWVVFRLIIMIGSLNGIFKKFYFIKSYRCEVYLLNFIKRCIFSN